MKFRIAAAFAALSVLSSLSHGFTVIDMSSVANTRFNNGQFVGSGDFPSGSPTVTFDRVPYLIPVDADHMWSSSFAPGYGSVRSVQIPVDVYGVGSVYTLIGTQWGETWPSTYASIFFFGSSGDVHRVNLDGGAEIRDYTGATTYPVDLNSSVTKEVWSNGAGPDFHRIDRQ
ncbi:MAG: hypothetical protein OEU93_04945, partial [Rubrivivax sp.]|nr:hypothetical protein [Rubrivivax sp.]